MRLELVARARCECDEVDEYAGCVRKAASMISSLNPMIWRVGKFVAREWYIMFWSACMEIKDEDDES
jgi:hypothetical protein